MAPKNLSYEDMSDAELLGVLSNIDEVLQEKAEKSYRHFFPFYWQAYSGVPLQSNWHIDVMCEHLQHAYEGQIRRLIFTVPPRSTKSSCISIASPAWRWIAKPETQFLCGSHSLKLITQNIVACRRIIDSDAYKKRYCLKKSPHYKFQLTNDQNTKGRVDTTLGGRLTGVSPDTKALGEGFNIGLLDDLLDYSDLSKLDKMEDVNDWISNLFFGRSNDKKQDVIVLIMQRLKEGDPVDHVKKKFENQNWVHINIPATYNPEKTYFSPLGKKWNDPRKPGELIDDGRICTKEFLEGLDPIIRAVQYEQDVSNFSTGIGVDREDIRYVSTLPYRFDRSIIVWDLTFKATEASKSWNVGTVIGSYMGNYYIYDSIRGKFEIPEQLRSVRTLKTKYPDAEIGIEDKANGSAVMQLLKREFPGIIPFKTNEWGGTRTADKEARFSAAIPYWKAKQVFIYKPLIPDNRLDASYDPEFIASEIVNFPLAETAEYVDTTSYGIPWLASVGSISKTYVLGGNKIQILSDEDYSGINLQDKRYGVDNMDYTGLFSTAGDIPSWDDVKNIGF